MTEANSRIQITTDSDISIEQLMHARERDSVVRTPHAGNFSPYGLVLAEAGIPQLVSDMRIAGKDSTYSPETLRVAGRAEELAGSVGTMVLRTPAVGEHAGSYLDQVHMDVLGKAFPETQVDTFADFYRARELEFGEITKIVSHAHPGLFERVVLPDGTVVKDPSRSAELARGGQILYLLDDPRSETEAAVVPNEVNIVSFAALESLRTGSDLQHHISGPAMAKYVGSLQGDIDAVYSSIRVNASFGSQLPKVMRVNMPSATNARFAVSGPDMEASQQQLIALMEGYNVAMLEYATIRSERAEFFRSRGRKKGSKNSSASDEEKAANTAFVKDIEGRRDATTAQLHEATQLIPEILLDAGNGGEIVASQHDVALYGLHSAALNRTTPFSELDKMTAALRKAQGGRHADT